MNIYFKMGENKKTALIMGLIFLLLATLFILIITGVITK